MATNLRPVLFVAVGAMLLTTSAFSQTAAAPAGKTDTSSGLEEVMVTAQRKEESLERTPVAISVVTADELVQRAIVSEQDLPSVAPGLGVRAALSSDQLTYAIRGGTLEPFSNSRPSVLPYFNEVQIGGAGSSSAFYDLQSVQALKGPQGTLFGRNSTGGAVLFTSQKPVEQFGGYVSGGVGNYSAVKLEGAIGGAIVPGKLLVRLAGLYQKRDGYQLNLFDGNRLGAVDRIAVRGSLTFKPTETIKDDLVVDYYRNTGASIGPLIYNLLPTSGLAFVYSPAGDAVFGPGWWHGFLALHPKVNPLGLAAEVAAQQARGPYIANGEAPSYTEVKNQIVTNATTIDLGGGRQFKNILGYTNLDTIRGVDLDGTPVPIDSQGPISGKGLHSTSKQVSEELQLLGKALDDKLSYVTGLYYANEKISYHTLSFFTEFSSALAPFYAGLTQQVRNVSETTNTSYAVYAQGTYSLAESTGMEGLSATLGLRYSDDKTRLVYSPEDTSYCLEVGGCPATAASPVSLPNAAYKNDQTVSTKKPSWTLGLQNQVNPNMLLYAATRGSFKSAGFNYSVAPKIGDGSAGGNGYKNEIVTDVELGMKLQSNANGMPMRLNLAAYNNWIKDRQATAYGVVNGGPAALTVNVPQAKVYGLEADGQIGLTHWLTVGGSANYTHAAYTAGHNVVIFGGNPILYTTYPDTPEYSESVFADVKIPVASDLEVSLHGDLSAQSETFFTSTGAAGQNPGARIAGYGLANFRLGLGDSHAGWSVSASVKNAFNRLYYVGGLPLAPLFGFNTAVVGEPRMYTLDARYKF